MVELKFKISSNPKYSEVVLHRIFQNTAVLRSLSSTGPGLRCKLSRHQMLIQDTALNTPLP